MVQDKEWFLRSDEQAQRARMGWAEQEFRGYDKIAAGAQDLLGNSLAIQRQRTEMDIAAQRLQMDQAQSASILQSEEVKRATAMENLMYIKELHTTDMLDLQKRRAQLELDIMEQQYQEQARKSGMGDFPHPPLTEEERDQWIRARLFYEPSRNGTPGSTREPTEEEYEAAGQRIEDRKTRDAIRESAIQRSRYGEEVPMESFQGLAPPPKATRTRDAVSREALNLKMIKERGVKLDENDRLVPASPEEVQQAHEMESARRRGEAVFDTWVKRGGDFSLSDAIASGGSSIPAPAPNTLDEVLAGEMNTNDVNITNPWSHTTFRTADGVQWQLPAAVRNLKRETVDQLMGIVRSRMEAIEPGARTADAMQTEMQIMFGLDPNDVGAEYLRYIKQ